MVRQTLLGTLVIGVETTAMGFCSKGEREIRLTSKTQGKCGFTAKEQSEGL